MGSGTDCLQLDNSIQLQIWDQSETHPNQQWYFEPVVYERKSDQPISGGIYMMRLGYSGQYMQVNGTTCLLYTSDAADERLAV